MTTDTSMRCALGVTVRTLSDFRSGGLSASEMERLRAHIEQCPACQAQLDAFEAVARALRSHPDVGGHAELWRDVQASIAVAPASLAARGHRSAQRAGHSQSARLWTAFGSIAAVVALSVGFAALFFSRGGWPPVSKTATPAPITIHSGRLTWKQVIVPKGFPGSVDQSDAPATVGGPAVAPSDGRTMYACQADRRYVSSPRVWVTHDAGVHWSVITPTDLAANTGGCRLWVDGNDANTLVVSFFPMLNLQQPVPLSQWVTYATVDGGATWSKPAGLQDGMFIGMLASAHGQTYAQMTSNSPNGDSTTGLYVSRDGMRSWTRIDATLPDTVPNPPQVHDTGKIFEMRVNPTSGEVLAITYADTLWSTVDDGAHWTEVAYPHAVSDAAHTTPLLFVGGPTTSAHMTICGGFTLPQPPNTQQIECTTDNGQTWSERPTSTSSSRSTPAYHLDLAGVGADGSLYATANIPSSPGKENGGFTIYRLPPGSMATGDWQALGAVPDSQHGVGFQIAPSANGVTIWDFPGSSTETSGSFSKTYVQPNYYVATYP